MNCKPGDLAVVVCPCKQQGRITRCVRLAGADDLLLHGLLPVAGYPAWVTEHEFEYGQSGHRAPIILDAFLRPIRDNDGEDETLTWAGKRERITA